MGVTDRSRWDHKRLFPNRGGKRVVKPLRDITEGRNVSRFKSPYRVLYRKDSDFWTNSESVIALSDYDEMPTPGYVSVEPDNINVTLEDVFARFNRGSGREWDMPPGMRSLSVGDVVIIGELAFACDRSGWSSVQLEREDA